MTEATFIKDKLQSRTTNLSPGIKSHSQQIIPIPRR